MAERQTLDLLAKHDGLRVCDVLLFVDLPTPFARSFVREAIGRLISSGRILVDGKVARLA